MDFDLNELQTTFQTLAKEFTQKEIQPYAKTWDETHYFPIETLKKAAELGFAAMNVSEAMGGSNLTRVDSVLIMEALAYGCPSTAAYLSIHNMVLKLIDQFGSDQLRQKWLPALVEMKLLSSYCLTEPDSGSDAASLKTTAKREGNYYILNGTKAFISGGSVSDIYVCMVRTGEAGPKGISCLLVEKDTPGLSFGKKELKLGWHSQPTTMLFFNNCKVPCSHLIGELNHGFKYALSALNGGRVNIAACSLGGAKACLDYARQHLHERLQFSKPLADFQALQFKFADMMVAYESARLMVLRAANALDNQQPNAAIFCAMAKQLATDNGFNIVNDALQLFGGYGYIMDYPIERYFRDLRVHQILEGTNEIMRLIISRATLSSSWN